MVIISSHIPLPDGPKYQILCLLYGVKVIFWFVPGIDLKTFLSANMHPKFSMEVFVKFKDKILPWNYILIGIETLIITHEFLRDGFHQEGDMNIFSIISDKIFIEINHLRIKYPDEQFLIYILNNKDYKFEGAYEIYKKKRCFLFHNIFGNQEKLFLFNSGFYFQITEDDLKFLSENQK